jgi:hypothetical protein
MSDLQIALTALGALVIGCVIAYNRIQENRFRRRAQETFSRDHGDPLLDAPGANREDRIEPLLTSARPEAQETVDTGGARPGRVEPSGMPAAAAERTQEQSAPIEYPAVVTAGSSLQRSALRQLLEALDGSGRRTQVMASVGKNGSCSQMQPTVSTKSGSHSSSRTDEDMPPGTI